MRTMSFSTLVLFGMLGLASCGGTDHRLTGNTQAVAPVPPATVVVPSSGPARVCPYGRVC